MGAHHKIISFFSGFNSLYNNPLLYTISINKDKLIMLIN
jgi:hypothetical protein